jgi:hypothetical protein
MSLIGRGVRYELPMVCRALATAPVVIAAVAQVPPTPWLAAVALGGRREVSVGIPPTEAAPARISCWIRGAVRPRVIQSRACVSGRCA